MSDLDIDRILEEIVAVVFGGEEVATCYECTTEQRGKAGADCAEEPGGVEIPARHGKVLVVIVKEGLDVQHASVNSLGPLHMAVAGR